MSMLMNELSDANTINWKPKRITPYSRESKMIKKGEMSIETCKAHLLVQSSLYAKLVNLFNEREKCAKDELNENVSSCCILEMFIEYNDKIISTHECIKKMNE